MGEVSRVPTHARPSAGWRSNRGWQPQSRSGMLRPGGGQGGEPTVYSIDCKSAEKPDGKMALRSDFAGMRKTARFAAALIQKARWHVRKPGEGPLGRSPWLWPVAPSAFPDRKNEPHQRLFYLWPFILEAASAKVSRKTHCLVPRRGAAVCRNRHRFSRLGLSPQLS